MKNAAIEASAFAKTFSGFIRLSWGFGRDERDMGASEHNDNFGKRRKEPLKILDDNLH